MISSGNREIIRWLVEHKKINVCVTTAGGIEEDIIKCLGDFVLGDFRASGSKLREKGINRIGNIYAPNNRYSSFEDFFQPILKELAEEQKKTGKIITPKELIWKLGEKIGLVALAPGPAPKVNRLLEVRGPALFLVAVGERFPRKPRNSMTPRYTECFAAVTFGHHIRRVLVREPKRPQHVEFTHHDPISDFAAQPFVRGQFLAPS